MRTDLLEIFLLDLVLCSVKLGSMSFTDAASQSAETFCVAEPRDGKTPAWW